MFHYILAAIPFLAVLTLLYSWAYTNGWVG